MTADNSFLAPVLVLHGCCCAASAVLCSGYALTCPVGGSWSQHLLLASKQCLVALILCPGMVRSWHVTPEVGP
ncbi:hypothetical protein COO60DRAFT_1551712 [Scenedesmus sp. NREL 46B-D3]|nr:hypothetical protein COO60DRAFT_1551712 [Scenedesmus sp. NREL 46B-D3]